MHISKEDRELIRLKFGGLCAYSGTKLEHDWQPDHVKPVIRNWYNGTQENPENHNIDNIFPVQKTINHYKGSLDLELFRTWYLGGLHERLKKLPKNPRTEKGAKRKSYMLKVASYFGITENKPFDGVFYFEKSKTINHENKTIKKTTKELLIDRV